MPPLDKQAGLSAQGAEELPRETTDGRETRAINLTFYFYYLLILFFLFIYLLLSKGMKPNYIYCVTDLIWDNKVYWCIIQLS